MQHIFIFFRIDILIKEPQIYLTSLFIFLKKHSSLFCLLPDDTDKIVHIDIEAEC